MSPSSLNRPEPSNLSDAVEGHRYPPARRRVKIRYQQPTTIVPVSAMHLGQGDIDLNAVKEEFSQGSKIERFGKTSIVIQLADQGPENAERFLAVYRFGSLVLFNVDDPIEVSRIITKLQRHSTQPGLAGFERKETFAVHVSPDHPVVHPVRSEEHVPSVTADYCIVPQLGILGVAVISNIMAQTVALSNYNNMIEKLLSNFESINRAVTKTGNFSAADKDFLFKTVAQNYSIFIDMISKIRIKDRADTAWNFTKYETIHYGLKDEFELEEQFENIEFKLRLIQQNAKFFLQMLHEENSHTVEWIIIALIVLEGALMIVEMSGLGEIFFQRLLSGNSIV